jgi:hypothetical protein
MKKNMEIITILDSHIAEPEYLNLFDPEKQKNDRFNQLKKYMQIKNNIIIMNNALNLYYRYVNIDLNIAFPIDAKKFMIAWIIVGFPEYVLEIKPKFLESEINIYPYDIYYISNDMIKNFRNILISTNLINLTKFNKSLNKYSNAINYFFTKGCT